MSANWSEEKIDTLKRMWQEGFSANQIADELGEGATRNSVIGKVHRLKLEGRPKQHGSKRRKPKILLRPNNMLKSSALLPRHIPPRTKTMQPEPEQVPETKNPEEPVDIITSTEELLQSLHIPLLGLTEHTCKWPMGDPLTSSFGFCGQPTEKTPYCEFHSRRAYHLVERKKRTERA